MYQKGYALEQEYIDTDGLNLSSNWCIHKLDYLSYNLIGSFLSCVAGEKELKHRISLIVKLITHLLIGTTPGKLENTYRKTPHQQRQSKQRTTPRIPTWSPTVVLTGPEHA